MTVSALPTATARKVRDVIWSAGLSVPVADAMDRAAAWLDRHATFCATGDASTDVGNISLLLVIDPLFSEACGLTSEADVAAHNALIAYAKALRVLAKREPSAWLQVARSIATAA